MKCKIQVSNLNTSFTGRIKNRDLAIQTRKVFLKNFPALLSPSFIETQNNSTIKEFVFEQLIDDICLIRNILNIHVKKNNPREYFEWLFKLVKIKQVANCSECAEITNAILKMNNTKNSDIFHLYAKTKDGKIRFLDHTVTVLGVKKRYNNKKNQKFFKPNKNVIVIDMWYKSPKGLIVKFLYLKKRLKNILKIKDNEELILKPIQNLPLDNKTVLELKRTFPEFEF